LNLSDEPYQYLYSEGDKIHLLNLESFEEIEMAVSKCDGGDRSVAMLEGTRITHFSPTYSTYIDFFLPRTN
jgi:translation elongation factor P/translation initiation factor 5A